MQTTSLFRRAAALALTLVLAVSASLAGFATYDMPIQTVSDTESVYLFNLDTGKPILDQNAGQSRYIASLTKMMTALLFLESGKDLNEGPCQCRSEIDPRLAVLEQLLDK